MRSIGTRSRKAVLGLQFLDLSLRRNPELSGFSPYRRHRLCGFLGCHGIFLGYVPYVSFALTAIPPAFFGLLQYGIVGVLAVIIAISLINALNRKCLFSFTRGERPETVSNRCISVPALLNYVLGATNAAFHASYHGLEDYPGKF